MFEWFLELLKFAYLSDNCRPCKLQTLSQRSPFGKMFPMLLDKARNIHLQAVRLGRVPLGISRIYPHPCLVYAATLRHLPLKKAEIHH